MSSSRHTQGLRRDEDLRHPDGKTWAQTDLAGSARDKSEAGNISASEIRRLPKKDDILVEEQQKLVDAEAARITSSRKQ